MPAVAAAGVPRSKAAASRPQGPGIRSAGSPRSQAAPAPRYTIHTIGYPSGFPSSAPTGFNNTGQIFGLVNLQGARVQDCRLWTGSAFERLPLPAAGTCVATSISDAASGSGEYEIVGAVQEPLSEGSRAFAALATSAGFVTATIYYANSPSFMLGVNAAQTAVAAAAFERDTLADYRGLLYFTATHAARSLATLQAPAAPEGPAIHNLLPLFGHGSFRTCVFGGCVINAQNEVLGYDELTVNGEAATLALFTVGEPSSLVHLPISDPYTSGTEPIAFNDAGQLVYFDPLVGEPVVYGAGTRASTILPVIPPGCPPAAQGIPLGMNNHGEVLGYVQNCPSHDGYWTWDPVHGTQYLDAAIPANAYTIFPLGVNDKGQILIELIDGANVDAWGTLDLVVPSSAPGRQTRR